jgi:hypothetical protein
LFSARNVDKASTSANVFQTRKLSTMQAVASTPLIPAELPTLDGMNRRASRLKSPQSLARNVERPQNDPVDVCTCCALEQGAALNGAGFVKQSGHEIAWALIGSVDWRKCGKLMEL